MKSSCIHLVVFFLVSIAVASVAQEPPAPAWPGFRGPGLRGVAREATPPLHWTENENLAWKVAVPGPGSSSPIVLGRRVYVTCYSGYGAYLKGGGDFHQLEHHLVCFDRRSGKEVWDCVVAGPLEKKARAVQVKEHGFASPTPVTDGKAIYAYFGRAGVVAVDLEGKVRWHTDLGVPSPDAPPATNAVKRKGKKIPLRWGAAASPVLFGDLVIVNASEESNSVRALDRRTGALRWKYESANLEGCATTPVVVGPRGREVLVVCLGGEVWGLAPRTGERIWRVETGSRGGVAPTPVADAVNVYTFGGSGKSFAVRFGPMQGGDEARVVWKGQNLGIPSPLLHDGKLFLVRSNGVAVCLDADTGKVVHKVRLQGPTGKIYASPLLAGGRLYVVTRFKGTFVYSADGKFELLAHNVLDDESQFNASPAATGNELFLRSDRFVYCLRPDGPRPGD
jgi:outer membrane protein assembly factor BamB